jgi:hypothetical protein
MSFVPNLFKKKERLVVEEDPEKLRIEGIAKMPSNIRMVSGEGR